MFVTPEIEVVKFNVVDVITTSEPSEGGDINSCPQHNCPNAMPFL